MPGAEDEGSLPLAGELGDYRLLKLVSEGMVTQTYRARQTSVDREVLLERIKAGTGLSPERVGAFLADVRAKAAILHAGIGSVYEAVDGEQEVYYTKELLPGRTFQDLREEDVKFDPIVLAGILRQVSGAMDFLSQRGIATLPLKARHIILSGPEVVRIANLAVAGAPDPGTGALDRALLGELLGGMVRTGEPGARRTSRLLGIMMSREDGVELSWAQVGRMAQKLEQELSTEICVAGAEALRGGAVDGGGLRVFGSTLFAVLLLGLVVAGAFVLFHRPKAPEARDLRAMVEIPAGTYLGPNGKEVPLGRFWIDAHEVTIAEYAEFLEALASVGEDRRDAYDHINQPTTKLDHQPDDWASIVGLARVGGNFEGRELTLNCPVTGIDWWDAHAYANWKGGRLPTLAQWEAAAGPSPGPVLSPGGWGAVDQEVGDVTDRGVYGLAGNVAEWLEKSALNPSFPMNATSPVAAGGSFLKPGRGVRERSWLETRGARRPELGFRVVRDAAP